MYGKRTAKSRCFFETIGISGLKRQAPPNRAAKRLWKKGGNRTENVRQDDGKNTEKVRQNSPFSLKSLDF